MGGYNSDIPVAYAIMHVACPADRPYRKPMQQQQQQQRDNQLIIIPSYQ